MVNVLSFYSDDPSSNPDEVFNFFVKIVVEKNRVGPFKKLSLRYDITHIQIAPTK